MKLFMSLLLLCACFAVASPPTNPRPTYYIPSSGETINDLQYMDVDGKVFYVTTNGSVNLGGNTYTLTYASLPPAISSWNVIFDASNLTLASPNQVNLFGETPLLKYRGTKKFYINFSVVRTLSGPAKIVTYFSSLGDLKNFNTSITFSDTVFFNGPAIFGSTTTIAAPSRFTRAVAFDSLLLIDPTNYPTGRGLVVNDSGLVGTGCGCSLVDTIWQDGDTIRYTIGGAPYAFYNQPTGSGNSWDLTGNAGTQPAINFIGTTDNKPVIVKANNITGLKVLNNSYVFVGDSTGTNAMFNETGKNDINFNLKFGDFGCFDSLGNECFQVSPLTGAYYIGPNGFGNNTNIQLDDNLRTININDSVTGFYGKVAIADGTEGPGKVLTSDAYGNATWQTLPAGLDTSAFEVSGTENQFAYFNTDTSISGNSHLVYEPLDGSIHYDNYGSDSTFLHMNKNNVTIGVNDGGTGDNWFRVQLVDGFALTNVNANNGTYNLQQTKSTSIIQTGLDSTISITTPHIAIVTGNEGAGKVLTSDASGNATWQNLPADLDTIHTVSKGVIFGNSTVASYLGYTAVRDYLMTSCDSIAGTTCVTKAVPGDTIYGQMALWLADTNKATYDWIIVEIGLNDLNPPITISGIAAKYQAFIDTINHYKKSTAKVIVATMTPAKQRFIDVLGGTNGALAYTNWLNLNNAIMGLSAYKINNVDYRVNAHTAALNDGAGNLAAPYNTYADNVHENNYGRKVIASAWRAALQQLGFLQCQAPEPFTTEIAANDTNILFTRSNILGKITFTSPAQASSTIEVKNTNSGIYGFTQMGFVGTGREFTVGVGNSSETYYGVANKFYINDVTAPNANRMCINTSGQVGFGTTSPSARLHPISTTEQLRVGYDASNYYSTTVGSTGSVTFNAVGTGSAFTFSDAITVTGKVTLDSLQYTASFDSATIYALTPTKTTVLYCNNCTGDGITGRILAYIAAAWRRLKFE